MNLIFSKREKILALILIVTIIIAFLEFSNKNTKIDENVNTNYTTLDFNNNKDASISDKDIIIKIENEMKNLVTIESITKYESQIQRKNIQICMSGKVDDIFEAEQKLKSIGVGENINKIEIIKSSNIKGIEDKESINNYIECIIEIEII